jgi:hypothetical protein
MERQGNYIVLINIERTRLRQCNEEIKPNAKATSPPISFQTARIKPVDSVLRRGERGKKGNDGGGKSN